MFVTTLIKPTYIVQFSGIFNCRFAIAVAKYPTSTYRDVVDGEPLQNRSVPKQTTVFENDF
jgi:hypothetical protein